MGKIKFSTKTVDPQLIQNSFIKRYIAVTLSIVFMGYLVDDVIKLNGFLLVTCLVTVLIVGINLFFFYENYLFLEIDSESETVKISILKFNKGVYEELLNFKDISLNYQHELYGRGQFKYILKLYGSGKIKCKIVEGRGEWNKDQLDKIYNSLVSYGISVRSSKGDFAGGL